MITRLAFRASHMRPSITAEPYPPHVSRCRRGDPAWSSCDSRFLKLAHEASFSRQFVVDTGAGVLHRADCETQRDGASPMLTANVTTSYRVRPLDWSQDGRAAGVMPMSKRLFEDSYASAADAVAASVQWASRFGRAALSGVGLFEKSRPRLAMVYDLAKLYPGGSLPRSISNQVTVTTAHAAHEAIVLSPRHGRALWSIYDDGAYSVQPEWYGATVMFGARAMVFPFGHPPATLRYSEDCDRVSLPGGAALPIVLTLTLQVVRAVQRIASVNERRVWYVQIPTTPNVKLEELSIDASAGLVGLKRYTHHDGTVATLCCLVQADSASEAVARVVGAGLPKPTHFYGLESILGNDPAVQNVDGAFVSETSWHHYVVYAGGQVLDVSTGEALPGWDVFDSCAVQSPVPASAGLLSFER